MSEFYRLRRTKITDAMALLGFLVGFFVPAYSAGKRMADGFDLGMETQGLTYFVATILASAIAGGVIGLVGGIVSGWAWEKGHKLLRARTRDSAPPMGGTAAFGSASAQGTQAREARVPTQQHAPARRPDETIRFDNSGFTVTEFLDLMRQVIPGEHDAGRTLAALERTVNIGAWDAERLVGAVRVLSDGYLFATIPEIIVDPAYRMRGIGRELMLRAAEQASTGVILFGSPPESSGFFEHLGCQRAPSGYVFKRKVAPTVRTK